jgi:hypothetical protein
MGVIDIILAKFWLHGRREGPGHYPQHHRQGLQGYIGGYYENQEKQEKQDKQEEQENQHHWPRLLGRPRALASGIAVEADTVKVLDFIITPTFAHTVQLTTLLGPPHACGATEGGPGLSAVGRVLVEAGMVAFCGKGNHRPFTSRT